MSKIQVTKFNNTKEILKYDHFVSEKVMLKPISGTVVGNRKIVKAGTIIPANDATAKGVVLYDVDVTNGNEYGAMVVHGFIDTTKMDTQPSAAAKTALTMIKFV